MAFSLMRSGNFTTNALDIFGKVADCSIKFDNNSNFIFYAGEKITGTFELIAYEAVDVERLTLFLKGFGYFSIYNGQSLFSNKDNFLNNSYDLIETRSTIQPGPHLYNFAYHIPRDIPPSVEDKHGHIRYQMIAIFVRDVLDLKYSFQIQVIKSAEPALQRPWEMEIVKYLAYNSSDTIKMIVSLRKRVFVAGEDAEIVIDIYRIPNGEVNIKYIEIKLLKEICYTYDGCCGPDAITRKKTSKKEFCSELPFNGFKFKLPSFIASSQNLCKIFDVSYFLQVKGKVSGCKFDPVKIPIVIIAESFRDAQEI